MSFAREGLVFIAIAALIAAGTYALALNRRSWPLWLLAFLLTIIALWVAYFFRDPERTGPARRRRSSSRPPTARSCSSAKSTSRRSWAAARSASRSS